MGQAEQTTAGRPLIVVMPDITLNGNGGGWCSDWPDGAQRWETFHIDQLLPWVDHSLRTLRSRGQRAIAGLSQGGFCSTSYAARHPDLFSIALAYSGAPDIYYDPDARAGAQAIINATEVGLTRVPPNTFFGDPLTDGINWAAHDPATLAPNLRDTHLFMYFGNGLPGPYDSGVSVGGSGIEGAVYRDNIDFHNRLEALHIPSLYDPYGNGTHSWPYWARDLRWSIGPLMADFAHPLGAPRTFSYTSADAAYSVYGWTVVMHRAVREFSTLSQAGASGFTLSGSGSATVTMPALRRRLYLVTLTPADGRTTSLVLRAARSRRLTVAVPLGPSNPYQQDTAQAQAAGTRVYSTRVVIRPIAL
jgi:S-formylglutathione hydrolase FrmB